MGWWWDKILKTFPWLQDQHNLQNKHFIIEKKKIFKIPYAYKKDTKNIDQASGSLFNKVKESKSVNKLLYSIKLEIYNQ